MKEIRYTRCYLGGEGHFSGGSILPGEERARLARAVRSNRMRDYSRVLPVVFGSSWLIGAPRRESIDYLMDVVELGS